MATVFFSQGDRLEHERYINQLITQHEFNCWPNRGMTAWLTTEHVLQEKPCSREYIKEP